VLAFTLLGGVAMLLMGALCMMVAALLGISL
jgi:hypothetical protein